MNGIHLVLVTTVNTGEIADEGERDETNVLI